MPDLNFLVCSSDSWKLILRNFIHISIPLMSLILMAACNLPNGTVTSQAPSITSTIPTVTLTTFTQSAPKMTLTSSISSTSTSSIIPTIVPPTFTKTPTDLPTKTMAPTISPTLGLGTIAGNISGYPYGSVPNLAIVAFGQEPPYRYWYLLIPAGSSYFSMDGYITTGNYQVVAYDSSGNAGGCTSFVLVKSNQTVNCDITNWGGGFPSKPSGVPNP